MCEYCEPVKQILFKNNYLTVELHPSLKMMVFKTRDDDGNEITKEVIDIDYCPYCGEVFK